MRHSACSVATDSLGGNELGLLPQTSATLTNTGKPLNIAVVLHKSGVGMHIRSWIVFRLQCRTPGTGPAGGPTALADGQLVDPNAVEREIT